MKIIIVGAGICGLSTYLHLRKHLSSEHSIIIYESHAPRFYASKYPPTPADVDTSPEGFNLDDLSKSTVLVGGGLGISPNGLGVLRRLDPELHAAVIEQGFKAEHYVFKGANGWTLGKQKTSDKGVHPDSVEEEATVASSRHGLWETIRKYVGDGVVQYRRITHVERDEETGKTIVKGIDGEGNTIDDVADLLIGADGSRSIVRTALFGTDEKYQAYYLSVLGLYPAHSKLTTYSGQSGVGGFLRTEIPDEILQDRRMVFTFGRNGFFGYSSAGPPSAKSLMWWSTFETSNLPQTKAIDSASIKQELRDRHKNWKDPILHTVLDHAEVESIYPTWVVPELPHWGENGIVLVGDAAHALDPTTGQGASQALEDSETLSLLLARCLKLGEDGKLNEREANALAIKLFHEIRGPRIHKIVERGKKISGQKGNMSIVAEYFMYFFLWTVIHVPAIGMFKQMI
ncbi:FAD/NAD(P)-binding domain-containing protein [Aaosphaeria arxii CBS 175.79]|uniref:FAD/NAD(P)-binding domain-containing protein n=1 Tax=Aaosphaeria arxii CBS 175.79 TaxID=1450172 RepID=A0A6A5Y5F1_9PLEO|nr:FAD/NAD(P)-binding domain-containing protein [Aaosphaeria arxii CBS 175.79]KAF2020506.1 FAD/NAD(P)-binding domain-containing protein [Aaosphaeria arxii CBS 175.79]